MIGELELSLRFALDTHVHADHVTAAGALRDRLGCKTVMSERAGVGCADVLAKEGDVIRFGGQERGVERVASMAGGMIAWSQAGLPVSR